MTPTINKDFTPQQIQRDKQIRETRKADKPVLMQCLRWFNGEKMVKITVWQAGLMERLRIMLTGKCYVSIIGAPMIWVDGKKPYRTNQLIQNTHKPKEESQQKKVTAISGGEVEGGKVVSSITDGKAMGGAVGIPKSKQPNE